MNDGPAISSQAPCAGCAAGRRELARLAVSVIGLTGVVDQLTGDREDVQRRLLLVESIAAGLLLAVAVWAWQKVGADA